MIDLQESRAKIDKVDKELLKLFEYRMQLAKDVADYKRSIGKAIYDKNRENEIIASMKEMASDEFSKKAVVDLFTQIMSISRRLQYQMISSCDSLGFTRIDQLVNDKKIKVAFYGEKGSNTEQAMIEYFDNEIYDYPMATFEEVMEAIKEEKADYGVLPIENSTTGTLSDIFDLLAKYDNYIIGEYVMKINFHLLGLPESELDRIDTVYSHPQGFLQCSDFFEKYDEMKKIESGSTSSSAKRIIEEGCPTRAAIANKRAADVYGLKILKESIHNDHDNSTRFIIIANKRIYLKGANRTSICFTLPHKSGSLYHMLSHFIYNNINMTRIESRPIAGKAFEYRFFVDIDGSLEDPNVKNALHCIGEEANEIKILGNYIPAEYK